MAQEYDLAALPTVLRGRGFTQDPQNQPSFWGLCLTWENERGLIPYKLYHLEASANPHRVWVNDENGARQLYPTVWFTPVRLSPKLALELTDFAQAA